MNDNIDFEVARKQEIYFRIARLMWAAMLLVCELHTGQKPNWRRGDG